MKTTPDAYVGVDVGGTNVEAACITAAGEMLDSPKAIASPSQNSLENIISSLVQLISSATASIQGYQIEACGIGMPNPFDYQNGISAMRHKFNAIYGLDILHPLQEKTGLPIRFVNDAAAFGIGCSWKMFPKAERIIALTIGTGLGSSFIERGEDLDDDERVPPGGEMWDLPHGDGKLEDFVSSRAITQAYAERTGQELNAQQIAELAHKADNDALYAFVRLGRALGQGLKPIFDSFQPEKIVIGGKVARSLGLFSEALEAELCTNGRLVMQAPEENLAIYGAARYVMTHKA